MRSSTFFLFAFVALVCASLSVSALSVPVPLGSCSSFALMAGSSLNANGVQSTVHSGSIGVSPGTSITGNIVLNNGAVEDNSAASVNCAADELIAYAALKGATCDTVLADDDLSGRTFTAGTYCTAGSVLRLTSGSVTLDGEGDADAQFIFQSATNIETSPTTSVVLINGASAANVYWQSGALVSLGYSSRMVGNVFAYTAVTFDHDAMLSGRAFAQTAITFAGGDEVTMA